VRYTFYVPILAVAVMCPLHMSARVQRSSAYQRGRVLTVERKEVTSANQCCYSGTDAPPQTESYAYEVAVRVGCATYKGRYETIVDYLPSILSPGKAVPVRVTRHSIYFDVSGEHDLEMNIVHRSNDRAAPCDADTAGEFRYGLGSREQNATATTADHHSP